MPKSMVRMLTVRCDGTVGRQLPDFLSKDTAPAPFGPH